MGLPGFVPSSLKQAFVAVGGNLASATIDTFDIRHYLDTPSTRHRHTDAGTFLVQDVALTVWMTSTPRGCYATAYTASNTKAQQPEKVSLVCF